MDRENQGALAIAAGAVAIGGILYLVSKSKKTVKAQVAIANNTVEPGAMVSYAFTGFLPDTALSVKVGTTVLSNVQSNSEGGGSDFLIAPATAGTYTLSLSDGKQTAQASFLVKVIVGTKYVVSVTADPSWGGLVSGGGTYSAGQSVTVSASPAATHTFTHWVRLVGNQVVSTSPQYTFTPTSDISLVAVFTQKIAQLVIMDISTPKHTGDTLNFQFANFSAYGNVTVQVVNGVDSVMVSADGRGIGAGSIHLTEAPGSWLLRASDSQSEAEVPFTIMPLANQTSIRINNGSGTIWSGNPLPFAWTGFEPNQIIVFWIEGAALHGDYNAGNSMSNSAGAGSGSFPTDVAPGVYTLSAMDSFGHIAHASFTVIQSGGTSNIIITDSVLQSGGDNLEFTVNGFTPNAIIVFSIHKMPEDVFVAGASGNTDANGRGSYSIPVNLVYSNYTLLGMTDSAHQEIVWFSVI